ncbi:hypothetical protein FQZ97_712710 [compost metagenome]
MEREPQELLPAMPPSVACALVDTSTGYQSPCGLSCAFRWSSTRPGSTVAVPSSTFTSSTLRKCLLLSITSAAPVVWPHWLVPPPRASTGTFRSRAMSMAVAMSRSFVGTKAPTGVIW